jgi:hypothetical protein
VTPHGAFAPDWQQFPMTTASRDHPCILAVIQLQSWPLHDMKAGMITYSHSLRLNMIHSPTTSVTMIAELVTKPQCCPKPG